MKAAYFKGVNLESFPKEDGGSGVKQKNWGKAGQMEVMMND
ncbi:hypothetical protein [Echinicola vietnamensis]|nr:hypothetical protein [Echinicola vietnamensis]